MFGFGRKGKIKKAADRFVEAMVMEAEKSFRDFLQVIMQALTDDDVKPDRITGIVNTVSPSLVYFGAIFTYELVKSKYAVDEKIAMDVTEEAFNGLRRNLKGDMGEGMRIVVSTIIENINFQNSMMPLGEDRELRLIGWNALKFFDFETNPEIRKLMDNTECTEKLTAFLEDACGSWWETAEKAGSF